MGVYASTCVYRAATVYAFEDQRMTLGFWIYRIGSLLSSYRSWISKSGH